MTTQLYIGAHDMLITNADQMQFIVKPILYNHEGQLIELRSCYDIAGVGDVQFSILTEQHTQLLRLPRPLRESIVWFLETHHAKEHMDFMCFDFVHHVVYKNMRPINKEGSHDWRYIQITSTSTLRRGSIVKFHRGSTDGVTSFVHAAVYLGRNLFISVYGAGGDLEVSTFEDMKRDFGAPQAVHAIPRY